jgi:hypothetical protein
VVSPARPAAPRPLTPTQHAAARIQRAYTTITSGVILAGEARDVQPMAMED